jgi:cytochrome P450
VALVDFHILDPDVLQRGVPHDAYREIRRREPVYWQELPEGAGYWALSKHADVQRVSRDPATFSANARGVNLVDDIHDLPTLLSLDPPEHTEMRRRVLYAFTPKVVRSLEPRMREIVRRALDRATDLRECDFVRDLAAPLPLEVIGDILGVPAADRAMVGRWADTLAGSADPEVGAGLEGKGPNQAALEFGTYAFQLGQKRADRGEREGHDLISVLLDAELDGTQVDLPTFAGLFVQIAIAGNETTRSLLSGGYLELMRRPRDCAALAADPSLVPAAVEEMLRWVSPVHYFRRTATRDVVVRGQEIAAGDRVVMLYASRGVRLRRALLPRRGARPPRGARLHRGVLPAFRRDRAGRRRRAATLERAQLDQAHARARLAALNVGRSRGAVARRNAKLMCRNIKTLFNFEPPANDDEIRAASLQFVRKLSGFNKPSKANEAAFDRAVEDVSRAARDLLASLVTKAPPRSREVEAAKARSRAAARFG